ncbi:MAG: S9 family peptidase [Blastocatellia bacterium]|nr:S9 family peptidase [Blastocatellia bacterium]
MWTCLMVLFSGLAGAQTRPLSVMDIFNLEVAVDPQLSPDGTRIVYVRQFCDIMTDQRKSNLWMVNFDGTEHHALTSGNFNDSAPRWSPDGKSLLFQSNRDGSPQLYCYRTEDRQMAKLTSLTAAPSGANWSPDGKWISFTMLVPEAPPAIIKMPPPPEGAKWADPAKVTDRLVYRFNGLGYLKPGYAQVFVVPAEGGTPRQVTQGKFHHGAPFNASDAVWTPDGKYLILAANRGENAEFDFIDTNIYEFSVADGKVRALTTRKGPERSPAVSPDGKMIAFVGFEDRYQSYQETKLSVMDREGGNQRVISAKWDRDVEAPQWAPDGSGIYFLSDSEGNTGLYFITLDGTVKKLLGNVGSGLGAPQGSVSFAKNGAFAITLCHPHRPGDIAVGTVAKPATQFLTAINDDVLSDRKLGQVEEIWYESAKDKRKIQGWIIKPPDFDPAKKYPLILEIHGGPFANYGDRFDVEKQLMAAAGYVVLYTNPRGSTSYGEEFSALIHHAYPGDDFYDLNSGVDAVIAKGYVDPEQLYVTGGSGGGVLTCWMIGRSNRFRAAVSNYPVINWTSFVLTSDIGNFTHNRWFPGLPWEHEQNYASRSLLSVVKNVKTPTMVMCGEEDYRTPISEAEQYYQALKLLGVESVLVRVPNEPHGIRVRPSHHISKILHVIGWFDQHRKAEKK